MDVEPLEQGSWASPDARLTMTPGQARFQSWMKDVLIYVVVLNLFVEYAPAIIIESFTLSLLTAVLLKLMLDSILGLEHRVAAWYAQRKGTAWRVLGMATMFAILFLSKFVIIEVTQLIFGDRVKLGGFIGIAVLIVAMIATSKAVSLIYFRVLGRRPESGPVAT